jgi:PAS domain S-box-containing protein
MVDREELIKRQRVLAEFGQFVLNSEDLQEILDEGCRLIASALGADFAKVIEIDRDTGTGLVRAGIGWRPGIVGRERIKLHERSSETYALERTEPVITNDIALEQRFEFPEFMRTHGVIAIVNVPILLPGRIPYGILQVDARERRDFGQEDVEFLRTYAMALGPVIDRLKTLAELKHSDHRFELVVENATAYVMVLSDTDDRITDWLAGSEKILGWRREEVLGKSPSLIFTEEDRANGVPEAELARARRDGTAPDVRWHLRKDGGRVFLDGQMIALKGPDGEVSGFLKIGQDVTERTRSEERQAVLMAELQHRVRNVLTIVRSVALRTAAAGGTAEEIGERLGQRIDALARTQALLAPAHRVGVDLEKMVNDELIAQAAGANSISVSGPAVRLAPKAAEVMTLAVHELATNATKYGALACHGGHVTVRWSFEEKHGSRWLRLAWIESGVTLLPAAGARSGFGTELITRRIPYELQGHGEVKLAAGGVRCMIEFPLAHGDILHKSDD